MRRMLIRAGALLVAMLLLLCMGAFAEEELQAAGQASVGDYIVEGQYSLPRDFSSGPKLNNAYLISENEYKDPSLHVKMETGNYEGNQYWIARIKVSDGSQLRTFALREFRSMSAYPALFLAQKSNAVLAIDGDYVSFMENGFVFRQGEVIMNKPTGNHDLLLIDWKGDFHPLIMASAEDIEKALQEYDAANVMCFGPVLVQDGKAVYNRAYGDYYGADWEKQRIAIGQVGPGEYICVCTGHRSRGNRGMTLWEFADFTATLGASVVYNLDGGDSTSMIFMNRRVNDADCNNYRDISDIVYFASGMTSEK